MNEAGLDFYDRLVDELLANGIRPFVDALPLGPAAGARGRRRLAERATAEAFAEYVEVVAGRLGDRVEHWVTHNEPWVASWLGYGWGMHAPGRTSDGATRSPPRTTCCSPTAARCEILRATRPAPRSASRSNCPRRTRPRDSAEDAAAARAIDGNVNRWFLDPSSAASTRTDVLERFDARAPSIRDGDLETISAPIDFLGVNYYCRQVVWPSPERRRPTAGRAIPDASTPTWAGRSTPTGSTTCSSASHDDYAPPAIYVTENGAAFGDVRAHDGSVHDPERDGVPRRAHRRRRPRDRRRRAGPGLLRLVAARQLRVGARLREAVRDRLRRLPDARARAEVEHYWYRDFAASRREGHTWPVSA